MSISAQFFRIFLLGNAPRLLFAGVLPLAMGSLSADEACGAAGAAHFWLSTSSSGSPGPEAPVLATTTDSIGTLYIWGRPHVGRQLQSLSLNLIADATGIDFDDGSYTVYNGIEVDVSRFEFTRDSSTTPTLVSEYSAAEVMAGDVDGVYGINAFNLFGTPPMYLGMGPTCSAGEANCEIAGDGQPAWLIASIDIRAVSVAAGVNLYLQIGDRGMVEQTLAAGDYDFSAEVDAADYTVWSTAFGSTTELAADGNGNGVIDAADYTMWRDFLGGIAMLGLVADTEVRFGVDMGMGEEPMHNASTDKEINLAGDDPDAVISIVVPANTVPEPTTLGLMAWAASALVVRRYKGRSTS